MGGAYNYITYVMFDTVFWKAIAGQVNRWRKKQLGLKATTLDKMQPNKVPFLYNYSPSVVAPPLDYPDWIRITGYWFLSEGGNWTPPTDLLDFIHRARSDGKKRQDLQVDLTIPSTGYNGRRPLGRIPPQFVSEPRGQTRR